MFSVLTNDRSVPPARLYALLYLCFGLIAILLLLLVVPPYQVADEINHFKRADQVSRGGLVAHRVGASSGGVVSTGIDATAYEFGSIPYHSEAKVTPAMSARAAAVTWANAATAPSAFPNTANYPPFLYLPAAAGILFGKATDLGVVTTLTLARALSGILAVVVCAFAISIAGGAAPFVFAVLSLPMSLFQMASVSQDGPLFALAALSVAIFAGMRDRQAASMRLFVLMCVCAALVAMARPPYIALAVLPLLAYGRSWTQRIVAVVAISASVVLWVLLVAPIASAAVSDGADPPAQIAAMRAHPLTTLWIFGRSLTGSLLDSFIGRLGWLDTRLPIAYHVLAVAVLLFGAVATAASLRQGPGRSASALIVTGIVAALLVLFATMFVVWTAPGMTMVAGVQGRYLIPLALLAAAAIPSAPLTKSASFVARLAPVLLGLFAPFSIIVMIFALVRRYYFSA